MVMGANVQVCWEKFCRYWDVEPRLAPMEGDRYHLTAEEAVQHCDENTIGVVAGPRVDLRRQLRAGRRHLRRARQAPGRHRARRARPRRRRVRRLHRAVPRPRPRLGLPPPARAVDQRLGPQVRARVPGRRLGDLARPRRAARRPRVQRELPRRRHADVRAQLLATRQPGRGAVLQLPPPRLRGLPAGAAGVPRRRAATLADAVGEMDHFQLLTDGSELPGVRVHAPADGIDELHRLRPLRAVARPGLAGPGVHASPRTARTSPRSASSSATASRATSPTCSSPICSDTRPTSTS